MVDGVVEAPNGAHFTSCEPDYERDEAFQREYAEAAADAEAWAAFAARYLDGERGRLPGSAVAEPVAGGERRPSDRPVTRGRGLRRRRAPRRFRGDGEILASPIGTHPDARRPAGPATFEPDLLITDGEARCLRRRQSTPALGGTPRGDVVEGWMPVPHDLRRASWTAAARDDGRHPDRPPTATRTSPPSATSHKPKAQLLGVRGAPGNTVNHPHELLGAQALTPGLRRAGRHRLRASATTAPRGRARARRRYHELRRVVTNLGVLRLRTPGPHACGSLACTPASPSTRSSRPPASSWSSATTCPRAATPTDEELRADPRGARPEGRCATRRCRAMRGRA